MSFTLNNQDILEKNISNGNGKKTVELNSLTTDTDRLSVESIPALVLRVMLFEFEVGLP